MHYDRIIKLEKAAALKTQLSFHAAQNKLREKRAALDEEEERLKIKCKIATLKASVEVSYIKEVRGARVHDNLSCAL